MDMCTYSFKIKQYTRLEYQLTPLPGCGEGFNIEVGNYITLLNEHNLSLVC